MRHGCTCLFEMKSVIAARGHRLNDVYMYSICCISEKKAQLHSKEYSINMLNIVHLPVLIAAFAAVDARDITFPSLSGFSSEQVVMGIVSPEITQAKFGGLTTYANLPYVHCLAPKGEEVEKFDIAILGAPFDTVSCS